MWKLIKGATDVEMMFFSQPPALYLQIYLETMSTLVEVILTTKTIMKSYANPRLFFEGLKNRNHTR